MPFQSVSKTRATQSKMSTPSATLRENSGLAINYAAIGMVPRGVSTRRARVLYNSDTSEILVKFTTEPTSQDVYCVSSGSVQSERVIHSRQLVSMVGYTGWRTYDIRYSAQDAGLIIKVPQRVS